MSLCYQVIIFNTKYVCFIVQRPNHCRRKNPLQLHINSLRTKTYIIPVGYVLMCMKISVLLGKTIVNSIYLLQHDEENEKQTLVKLHKISIIRCLCSKRNGYRKRIRGKEKFSYILLSSKQSVKFQRARKISLGKN